MGQKMKWGILGCANIAANSFIPGILRADNAELYAISSRSESAKLSDFKQRFRPAKAYDSYEAMLDDPDVLAVYIPLPNGLHAEWTIKALEKKKHVMCEKPMGISASETLLIQETARQNDLLLMEAFAYLHSPLSKKVKEILDSGAIGKLRFIDGHFSFNTLDPDNVRYDSRMGGGATYDIGCYPISLVRHLIGQEPTGIKATGIVGATGVDLATCTTLLFAKNVTAVCYCSFEDFERSEYTVLGDKGMIHVPYPFNFAGQADIIVDTNQGTRLISVYCPDNYMLEVEQFGRAVLDGEELLVTPEFTMGNAVVIDEILNQVL